MSLEYPWYGLAPGDQLEQGDLFENCPIYRSLPDGSLRRETAHVVVLSQSCDLAHDKLELVQVCPYWPLETLAALEEFFRGKRGREELRRGNLPGYHLLNRCSLAGLESDFLVVDFRSLFGVHLAVLKELARRASPRVRLLPPYREHLAQAFARFFMRVGLPADGPPFR
jgi:hypothetical protein